MLQILFIHRFVMVVQGLEPCLSWSPPPVLFFLKTHTPRASHCSTKACLFSVLPAELKGHVDGVDEHNRSSVREGQLQSQTRITQHWPNVQGPSPLLLFVFSFHRLHYASHSLFKSSAEIINKSLSVVIRSNPYNQCSVTQADHQTFSCLQSQRFIWCKHAY